MEKRYQVFVSSTYKDLVEHRQTVIQALLQCNAFPVGMELFPAADEDAWTLIQKTIDASDYYMVIIGGRYGSTDNNGVGFTEKEYDYAVAHGKPVMAFLHGNTGSIERDRTETDSQAWEKLEAFREKTKGKHCRFWTNREELLVAVLASYQNMTYAHPAVGWVRGDKVRTDEDLKRLATLQDKIDHLERDLEAARSKAQPAEATAVRSATDRPSERFRAITRRLETLWQMEVGSKNRSVPEARQVLVQSRRQLVEFITVVDEEKHGSFVTMLRSELTRMHNLVRYDPAINTANDEFWDGGTQLVIRLKNLQVMLSAEERASGG